GYNSKNRKVLMGAWSHYARLKTDTPFGGRTKFDSYSYGSDFDFRLTPTLSLRGEGWAGSNLSDFRGGIGQSFNTTTGREIDSRGGWAELAIRPGRYAFSTGFTIDDPKNQHVACQGRTANKAWY